MSYHELYVGIRHLYEDFKPLEMSTGGRVVKGGEDALFTGLGENLQSIVRDAKLMQTKLHAFNLLMKGAEDAGLIKKKAIVDKFKEPDELDKLDDVLNLVTVALVVAVEETSNGGVSVPAVSATNVVKTTKEDITRYHKTLPNIF